MPADLRRKISLRCYVSKNEAAVLSSHLELHRLLTNAALQERIDAYQKAGKSISYFDQQNILPQLKKDMPELVPLGSHALQETLRRVDRAYQAFFRRVKAGQTPGFPRFKSFKRFDSFCYPDPAGWSYIPLPGKNQNERKGILQVGELRLRVRGMSRFDSFDANDLTLIRVRAAQGNKPAIWEASITLRVSALDCRRERTGNDIRGFDQGLTDRLTFDDGETVANTRRLRNKLEALAELQRRRAKCTKGSRQFRVLGAQVRKLHKTVANQRKDEIHKLTAAMVASCELLATEGLAVANMSRAPKPKPELNAQGVPTGEFLPNGAAVKAGLNRELLSSGMGFLLQLLVYKAEEAGTRFFVANTRKLKPTQRCACCGEVVKKHLDERMHLCEECGFCTTRDRNAALVCLVDALWPHFYEATGTGKRAKSYFFAADGYSAFIRNRLAHAAADFTPLDNIVKSNRRLGRASLLA